MDIFQKIDLYQEKLNELRPFEGNILNQIRNYYRIGMTWSSNALEGNTLTESETKILIEDGLTAGGKPLSHSFEALGHAKAYDYMFSLLNSSEITENDVLIMHKLFYSNIDEKYSGKYRESRVIITGSKYPVTRPDDIKTEMHDLFRWVKAERNDLHPVTFAAKLHEKFVFIHPFIDGNGRIARLLMNLALIQKGYMIAIIPPLLRNEYITLLEQAHKDDSEFINFIGERVLETQKDIMRMLQVSIPKINAYESESRHE